MSDQNYNANLNVNARVEGAAYGHERKGGVDAHSLVAHLSELADETTTLFRKEIELARAEMNESVTEMKKSAVMIGSSGAVMYAGALFVLGGITLLLGNVIPLWASALIVGLAALGAGWALFSRGKEGVKTDELVPRRTLRTVRETPSLMRTA